MTVRGTGKAHCGSSDRTLRAAAAAFAITGGILVPGSAEDGESDRAPAPLAVGKVVWLSGTSIRADAPAVPVGKNGLFAVLRPEKMPRARPEELTFGGRSHRAGLRASDSRTGLCLLEADAAAGSPTPKALEIEASGWPEPGRPVRAYDHGSQAPIEGRIAGRDQIYRGDELPVTLLRINLDTGDKIDRALPLTDESGEKLIGFLVPGGLDNRGEYHAIPAVFVAPLLRDRNAPGGGARLGASFEIGSTTPQIVSVREDSAAERAGLRQGDIVTRIGDWDIRRLSDVIETMKALSPGVPVPVEVLRGTDVVTVEVVAEPAGKG